MNKLINGWYDRMFPMPTHEELVAEELQQARRELLAAQSAQEHATAMVQFNSDRVARLHTALAVS